MTEADKLMKLRLEQGEAIRLREERQQRASLEQELLSLRAKLEAIASETFPLVDEDEVAAVRRLVRSETEARNRVCALENEMARRLAKA